MLNVSIDNCHHSTLPASPKRILVEVVVVLSAETVKLDI